MAVLLIAALVAGAFVVGDAWLSWWATGGGWGGFIAAVMLAPLALLVAHRIWLFASIVLWDGGSIRQAKRRLHEAEKDGRPLAALKARAELGLLRQNRRRMDQG